MEVRPHPSFADPVLADLVERARAAQMVAATAQSAVWAYMDQCQQGTSEPKQNGWPIHADHPDLLTVAQAAVRAGRHADTIGRWCRERGVGKMYGGRWRVSARRLNSLLA
ncbi:MULTISPECIES: hypothetical protein [unclassified Methylobacterium]|uniref:hypothetical protein n=1 Tax=unclassified Methylobacterium TaxID=2615210 RepID=UPI002269DD9A|nr:MULTISPECIES: hypothetical protein [unclassified Methylobacterium]